MTDQGVKSEKRLYRTRVFARVHPTPLLQVLAGKGRREGEAGKEKQATTSPRSAKSGLARLRSTLCQDISWVPLRRPRGDSEGGPARLLRRARGGQHCLPAGPRPRPAHVPRCWRERGPGVGASPKLYRHGVGPHLRAALAVCTSHNAELSREAQGALSCAAKHSSHYVPANRSVFVSPSGFSGW